jgi:hypothetical protein
LCWVIRQTTPTKKKRKRGDDASANDLLPDGPVDEAAEYGNLEFDEVLDEEVRSSHLV